ncbi:MAG: hypothetical protein AAF696_03040 [Bacteroidota bacterium]
MKFTQMLVLLAITAMFSFTSCEEACKQCSASSEIETFTDGVSSGVTSMDIPAIEYCGDALEMIDTGEAIESETTDNSTAFEIRQVSRTTYTCE